MCLKIKATTQVASKGKSLLQVVLCILCAVETYALEGICLNKDAATQLQLLMSCQSSYSSSPQAKAETVAFHGTNKGKEPRAAVVECQLPCEEMPQSLPFNAVGRKGRS